MVFLMIETATARCFGTTTGLATPSFVITMCDPGGAFFHESARFEDPDQRAPVDRRDPGHASGAHRDGKSD